MTTYHNPEVLPSVKVIPDPGDTITKFNRYYLCINPNPALGPPTWRVSDPDEYPCDGTVLPPGIDFMVAAQAPMVVSGDSTGVSYSFSMEGVPELDTGGIATITEVDNLEEPILLTNVKDDPVRSIYDNNDKATVTTFNIYGLLYESFSRNSGRSMRATVYNSSRSIPVTSDDPVQIAGNIASTDLFFDISSLPYAT
jgi:hypothetical protein